MAFAAKLVEYRAAVEQHLTHLLNSQIKSAPRLIEAMHYACLGPGKRIRPFFVLAVGELLHVDPVQACRVACALECVHCYSLVHDDLPAMDNDDLRRGRPTTHIAFDEATAILAGDSLLTIAFEILADPQTHPDANVRAELVLKLAQNAGVNGMAGGQMLDMQAASEPQTDLAHIILMQNLKTGALFRFALEACAILAKATNQQRQSLLAYADAIGLAFQITDDLLDYESTPEITGKRIAKDQAAGKATFVDLLGISGARQRASELVENAQQALNIFGPKADILRQAAQFVIERKS